MAENFIEFNGKKFYKMRNGYYKGSDGWLHMAVWKSVHGEIPEGYEIHHVDFDPSNNVLENLQCLPRAEHKKLHATCRPTHAHVCENCGKVYEARNYNKKNRFCSRTCRIAFLRKQGYYDVEKTCEFCGKTFITRNDYKARFCSNSCAKKANPSFHRANGQFVKKGEAVVPQSGVGGKFPNEIREQIRSEYVPYSREYGSRALAKKYGCNPSTIRRIVNEK